MYLDRLRLPLPKGVLPYIEVVDELLLLTQVIKERALSKYFFKKKQHTLHQQLIKMRQLKQIATLEEYYSSSQMAEFHPLLRVSRDHSIFQRVDGNTTMRIYIGDDVFLIN